MIRLTDSQRLELAGPQPTLVVDPLTNDQYVLVRAEVYKRLRTIVEDDPEAMYPFLADIVPEDWEDGSVYGLTTPKT